uniref:CRAL-TRIO domain-containing protein n=1 Tax=Anopheles albimanus TaxID=7167 RepID=A0A182FIB3_ANOAL
MANTPNSIEVQIDNFLEQFKRSASKAMDGDWSSSSSVTTPQSASSVGPKIRNLFSDQENGQNTNNGSSSSNASSYHSVQIQQQHNLNLFQHQSSVASVTSVQTVLCQNMQNSTNVNKLIENVCQNGNHFNLNTFGSCSSLITTNGHVQTTTVRENMNSAVSVSSAEEPLSVADVAELLHPQYAIITDYANFHNLTDTEYQKLILYLTSVPSLSEVDMGFNLIIDRRKDRWAAVKAVLLKISVYFPAVVHFVYVIRPAGFLQKAISEVSNKFFKEDFRFRVIVCSTLEELYDHVCRSQLTVDMGGELVYSHHEWIQQRISLEKFSGLTNMISCNLDAFMKTIHEMEFPNSVEATEKLMLEQGDQYEKLKEDILSAGRHGEALLEEMKTKRENDGEALDRFGNISSIERLLVQLEETERHFEDFWTIHLSRLRKCLELRRFEHEFRELQVSIYLEWLSCLLRITTNQWYSLLKGNFDRHLKTISDMTEIGETVTRMDQLLQEIKDFKQLCCVDIKRAEQVISTGQRLIGSKGCISSCPKEVVQPKCDELDRVCVLVNDRILKRIDTLAKARELMERVEKANQWCARGIELLATQRIEKCSVSAEIAEQSLQEIQHYLATAAEFDLSSPRDFKNEIVGSTTLETKALVSQVLQRIDDVQLMCDKRMTTLKKLTFKPPRPVQTVTPEPAVPLQPPGGAPHPIFRTRRSYNKV